MSELIDQPSPLPTRKLGAASAVTALIAAIAEALFGFLPGAGEELRDALTTMIDALIAGGIGGIVPLIGGYFVRDRDPL